MEPNENERKTVETKETVTETRPTEASPRSTSEKVPDSIIAARVCYYIGGVIISLLAIRFLLQLFGASEGSGFVDFIYTVSGFFVAPFYGIFGDPTYGNSQIETSSLVAIVVYGLLTIGFAKLFTLNRRDRDVV